MTFRISRENQDHGTLLRIEGNVSGDGLSVLRKAWKRAVSPLTVDLNGLLDVDKVILRELQLMEREGVNLMGASPYLKLQLADKKTEG
jgi:hypothetical protein